ncbi:MAG: DNA-directed RNA polymerase subunit beta' [Chloroflexi bacterium]|nr:DNA-directed RNA polymerase subunit beta' [Chloroflexota bacterium]
MVQSGPDFNAIRIGLASPEQIRMWSYGEVTKPETINYRTLRPERDGLFCERIFGPTKDWECACGKYKKIRFRGVKCERCGVEITRSKVRRDRMGHIELAAPVAHIWFSKGIPSRLGLLLDLSPRSLERVLYFAQYIITEINEEVRESNLATIETNYNEELAKLTSDWEQKIALANDADSEEHDSESETKNETLENLQKQQKDEFEKLESDYSEKVADLNEIRIGQLILEAKWRDLSEKHPGLASAGMGAAAMRELLTNIDLDLERDYLVSEMRSTSGQRRKKAVKRLRVVEAFRKSASKPEWMILDALPILPPDLRPMVQLDGGRFATSDLNDLYRRVINRNNRLRRLLELEAPEVIVRNEKRMLQEAVDALIDNGRRGRAISGTHNHKLKSLSDLLRGKQGRFRQNLLGKRVDYSGRSVIVAGPELRLDQCGLPKKMALELFKPFVMQRLVLDGIAHNIKSAKRVIEEMHPEVWDILEDVTKDRPVLLNRAPTLHRLGLQAFMPVLIEGSAIQVHPLVCTAFNADFDGDQMAVHVPLSGKAVLETKELMLAVNNMLSPASGDPLVAPTLDIVMGCYYLTQEEESNSAIKLFGSIHEADMAHELGIINLQEKIQVIAEQPNSESIIYNTTAGRLKFREILSEELAFVEENWNKLMDKSTLKDLVVENYKLLGNQATAKLLDNMKRLGYHYATISGITIGINDLEVPDSKAQVVQNADQQILQLGEDYQRGLVNDPERHEQAVKIWSKASDDIKELVEEALPTFGGVALMARSGAKGNISQITQMAGMRGLMSDPKGQLIEVPVKSSFREGLSVLEYFISTHGARKGLADTALRTADSGYLTRRMIDVAQDVIASAEDCETIMGIWISHNIDKERNNLNAPFGERLIGRYIAAPIAHPETGEIIFERNTPIKEQSEIELILDAGIQDVYVRSMLTCESIKGICQFCYGIMPATGEIISLGEAAGIIAAQSIGEPGTQLTMRTFHTGGVAGIDITSGIPRVEELFEARKPKNPAILAEINGTIEDISQTPEGQIITLVNTEEFREILNIPKGYEIVVKDNDLVEAGSVVAKFKIKKARKTKKDEEEGNVEGNPDDLISRMAGKIQVSKGQISVIWDEQEIKRYVASPIAYVTVKVDEQVVAGQELTAGLKDPHDLLRILGKEAVQEYILEEVQRVYRTQGVGINDKHIEAIIRQMLRKIRIELQGDTELLPGESVDKVFFDQSNRKTLAEGGEPARGSALLLGITRASLSTESFLAAASFQETTRVLTEAAINGAVDRLTGLKENVIIGRLIPTRTDIDFTTDLPFISESDTSGITDGIDSIFEEDDDELASVFAVDLINLGGTEQDSSNETPAEEAEE